MLVQASAFGSWLHRLSLRFYVLFMFLFSNSLFVLCDLVYLINVIWIKYITRQNTTDDDCLQLHKMTKNMTFDDTTMT